MESESKGELISPDQQATIATKEMKKLAAKVPTKISNDTELKDATELLARIKMTIKNTKAVKDPVIKGLNEQVKTIRSWFKPAEDDAANAERAITQAILKYHQVVEARAAKKAAKVEEKIDTGEMTMQQGLGKITNIKQAQDTVQTDAGTSSIVRRQRVRITDPAALPASYFLRERVVFALTQEVSADVLRLKKPCPPGAELYEEKGLSTRAA